MSIYKNLDRYFDDCQNCGGCCTVPGMFLPEQIDILAEHFSMSRAELFSRYLIAEMCAPKDSYGAPGDFTAPVFVLSPVKVGPDGKRSPLRLFNNEYIYSKNTHCIFRETKKHRCSIHRVKPFECAVMLCPAITRDNPVYLGKAYYYHKWKDQQEIIFSVFPELRSHFMKLKNSLYRMKKSFDERNRTMQEIAAALNSRKSKEAGDA
jgi:Fe-S-cluster containining protein